MWFTKNHLIRTKNKSAILKESLNNWFLKVKCTKENNMEIQLHVNKILHKVKNLSRQ